MEREIPGVERMMFQPRQTRHPELVSGSMPQCQSRENAVAWMLKQVQHDGGMK
jgi:hypothetical protein